MTITGRARLSRTHTRRIQRWSGALRGLVIAIVLLMSAVIAQTTSQDLLGYGLIFLGAVGYSMICLRWPGVGLISVIFASMFIGYRGPSNLNATVLLIALFLALWLGDMIVRERSIKIIPSRTFIPLLGLVLTAILSFGAGLLPWYSFVSQAPIGAQLAGLSIFILSAGAFFLMAHRIQSVHWLQLFTWAFVAMGAVFIVGRTFPIIGQLTEPLYQAMGPVFWVWIVAIVSSQAVFNQDLSRAVRIALVLLVIITVYVLLIQKFNDKSGWMPALFCIAIILSIRSPKYVLLLGLGSLLIMLLTSIVSDTLSTEQYSISTRLDAVTILLEIVKVNPILGLGFANYYWYTPLFPIRGFAVQFNSHNNYVDILAQTGVLGLLFFIWFAIEVARLGWIHRSRTKLGFERAYVYGALGGLSGMLFLGLFADWVLPFFYNVGLNGFRTAVFGWLFLGGLVFITQSARSK